MKIFHINTNFINNALHQNMTEALNVHGIESTVAVPTCDYKNTVIEPKSYVSICECFSKFDRVWYGNKQRKIFSYIDSHFNMSDYDAIHAYTLFTDGNVAYRLKKKYGIPYVVAVRNTDVNTFFKYMIHLRKRGIEILKNASAVFFLSKAYEIIMFDKYIPQKYAEEIRAKSYVIPNGLDPFWLANIPEESKNTPDKKIKICFAGKIDNNKNCELTADACKKLISEGYDVEYTVIGKLIDESLKAVIDKNEFITHIPFLKKEELVNYYRRSDIFVMPSFKESFGMVYAEAMSQGLPVIYTKGQGFDGQFEEGVVGYRVDSSSSDDIVMAIKNILSDYENKSKRCIKNAASFDWNKISEKYKEIYNDKICK